MDLYENEKNDIYIQCSCGDTFVFTVKDQEFYARQNPPYPQPKRCKKCRDKRKAEESKFINYKKTEK